MSYQKHLALIGAIFFSPLVILTHQSPEAVDVKAADSKASEFLIQPPARVKRKISKSVLWENLVENFEQLAYVLLDEVIVVSEIMNFCTQHDTDDQKQVQLALQQRLQDIKSLDRLFILDMSISNSDHAQQKSIDSIDQSMSLLHGTLMIEIAKVQKKILASVRHILEKNSSNCFVRASKQQLIDACASSKKAIDASMRIAQKIKKMIEQQHDESL